MTSIASRFPGLANGWARFDGPAGTQMVDVAIRAMSDWASSGHNANTGGSFLAAEECDALLARTRDVVGQLLNADPRGICLGANMTTMTFAFTRAIARTFTPNDRVVGTMLDHDANVSPWRVACETSGAEHVLAPFDVDSGILDPARVIELITPNTKWVAITGASNLIGTKPSVRAIADRAHAVGALAWVDGVHHAAHEFVDVTALGADFYVCSPYKFLGPHCAVLGASPDLLEAIVPDKLLPATNVVPERFEFGTLPYEMMAGATAAVDFIAAIAPGGATTRRERLRASYEAIHAHETRLRKRIEVAVAELGEWYEMHSRAADRTPTLLATVAGGRSAEASRFLAARNVQAPAGSFYAYEAFMHLGTADTHGLRMGLAPYNDDSDVDRLIDGLRTFVGA